MLRLAAATIIALLAAALPAGAYLRIHPDNPHYFQESTTGEAVMIASCAGVVPTAKDCNYWAQIKEMKEKNITYGRVWHFLPWAGENAIWPWAASDVDGGDWGGRGGKKLDMDKWNTVYWNRMKHAMSLCSKAGIYSEIHLFDRCGLSPGDTHRWQSNPWASNHSINNIETPDSSGDGTPDFYKYTEKPNLRKYQEAYVRKMIDETIAYPTIIYEIENEHWRLNDPGFGTYYATFVKDYIAEKYPDQPRLVSHSSLMDDLEKFYAVPQVDIVNRHYGNECERNPNVLNEYLEPRWGKNKAINVDEFANGVTDPALLRQMCWIIVASGGNFHIEDCAKESNPFEICENIRQFRMQSKWDFIHSAPNKKLVTSGNGYCMANPGKEYVVYVPKGGSVRLSVVAGKSYVSRWWSTTKNEFGQPIVLKDAAGEVALETPDGGEWVLYVSAMG